MFDKIIKLSVSKNHLHISIFLFWFCNKWPVSKLVPQKMTIGLTRCPHIKAAFLQCFISAHVHISDTKNKKTEGRWRRRRSFSLLPSFVTGKKPPKSIMQIVTKMNHKLCRLRPVMSASSVCMISLIWTRIWILCRAYIVRTAMFLLVLDLLLWCLCSNWLKENYWLTVHSWQYLEYMECQYGKSI